MLVKLGVKDCGAISDRLIVSKDINPHPDGHTKIMEGSTINSDLPISCSLNSCLLLGEPVNRHLVEQV
jgi:hypothetical protein